jgi:hypothetical protein
MPRAHARAGFAASLVVKTLAIYSMLHCASARLLGEADTAPPWSEFYPTAVGEQVPREFVLANETLISTLDRVAKTVPPRGPPGIVLFTTLRLSGGTDASELERMASNFCHWLHQSHLLRHTMLITTDEATWEMLAARGLPVYLDRAFPRRAEYQASVRLSGTLNREFDVQKHWWGWKLVSLGYRAVYMDSDNVVRGPEVLSPFDVTPPYDYQALSDWSEPELPAVGAALDRTCGFYYWVKEEGAPSKTALRVGMSLRPGEDRLQAANPCQSTGLWYLTPSSASEAFMLALVNRIAYHLPSQWDQTAANEVVMPHLWGAGAAPPLRYRLLPAESFANLALFAAREAAGLVSAPAVTHAGGYFGGADKRGAFEKLGLFHGDFRLCEEGTPAGKCARRGLPPPQPGLLASRPRRAAALGGALAVSAAALGLGLAGRRRPRGGGTAAAAEAEAEKGGPGGAAGRLAAEAPSECVLRST